MQPFESHETLAPVIHGEIIDQFFAPVPFDSLTLLVNQFEQTKARIVEVHEVVTQERVAGVMGYFFSGNGSDKYGHSAMLRHTSSVDQVFRLEGALNELTATYWSRAINETNLLDIMPQKRRTAWHEMLNAWREHNYQPGKNPELDMQPFTLDTLRATIEALMARRPEFLAERVDGIFSALSRHHSTNRREGFSKRMILNYIYNEWGSTDHDREGFIHDLRLVIAKFMGRDEPDRATTARLLKLAYARRGEWIEADGGSLRVRGYKVGTAHLEVHGEMAWRLNSILAYLHPHEIPETLRTRPARPKANGFKSKTVFERPFSNAVASILSSMETYYTLEPSGNFRREYDRKDVRNSLQIGTRNGDLSKHLFAEVNQVLTALGGVLVAGGRNKNLSYWQFDYYPNEIVQEVALAGHLPDGKSHQFYPTPRELAEQLVDWLDVQPNDSILEPEAGQGGIADLLPRDQTLCVEISPMHCQILSEKGHNVVQGDFLAWNPGMPFSCIAMNPPFSEGRWQEHLRHAASLVSTNGRIGAVLPLTARSQAIDLLPGFELEFSSPIDNAFTGTSISVLLLKAVKRA
ncbi:hypothetical protein FQZ97_568280 [compost metagenome]